MVSSEQPDQLYSDEQQDNEHFADNPKDIIDSWITLECLSPLNYDNEHKLNTYEGGKVLKINGDIEPWQINDEEKDEDTNIFYIVFFGDIKDHVAQKALHKAFKNDNSEIELGFNHKKFLLGAIVLKDDGSPIIDSMSISSFGWGYGKALEKKIKELENWTDEEEKVKEFLIKKCFKQIEGDKYQPLSFKSIDNIYYSLIDRFKIKKDHTSKPYFLIKIKKKIDPEEEKQTPDTNLLNSYYLNDLRMVKEALSNSPDKSSAFMKYLNTSPVKIKKDILNEREHIENALQPKYTPPGRWPSKGGYPLVLLQQTAVNLATNNSLSDSLFSVNGPPGTGKTTLLRDIIAHVVVERAKSLIKFKYPDNAFKKHPNIFINEEDYYVHKLDDSLKGYEIVVGSSNNKAVENISHELPLKEQINDRYEDLDFYSSISDQYLNEKNKTWGLISAALGNKTNREKYKNFAWEGKGFEKHFNRIIFYKEPKDGSTNSKYSYKPKNKTEALNIWFKKKDKFINALNKSEAMINQTQKYYDLLKSSDSKVIELQNTIEGYRNKITSIEDKYNQEKELYNDELQNIEDLKVEKDAIEVDKPDGFFSSERKEWKIQLKEKDKELKKAKSDIIPLRKNLDKLVSDKEDVQLAIQKYENELTKYKSKIDVIKSELAKDKDADLNLLLTGDEWFPLNNKSQQSAPNFTDKQQELRDDVFVAAIELHKAFLDAAHQEIKNNLNILTTCMLGPKLPSKHKELYQDLWSTLFILTPVISTALPSIGTMFKDIPQNYFGYLLLDEAGQATPQAALGAIYRSKKVISVGDPLQLQPINSLPRELQAEICRSYGVNEKLWAAPKSSVQTLSDKSNKYGTELNLETGNFIIGSPLLVHRRCEEPMFSMSNKMAYDRKMVLATEEKSSDITKHRSGKKVEWIDIQSPTHEKWSEAEGLAVLSIIKKLTFKLNKIPDIYVITPFTNVKNGLTKLIIKDEDLSQFNDKLGKWCSERVGTIHTFQGKEAEAVIILLGASGDDEDGSRNWAVKGPNLFNVAVSRAKKNLYIVGDKKRWSSKAYIKIVNEEIDKYNNNK